MIDTIDYHLDILKRNSENLTVQRIKLLEVFLEHPKDHFSPKELEDILKSKNELISFSTIYRNLKVFKRFDFIKSIALDNGIKKYELNKISIYDIKLQAHLICKDCGEIIDYIPEIDIEEILKREDYKSFKVKSIDINIYGICEKCR